MTNDISDTKPEDATACIALSKNDSYVMSASGGKVSLFNMITFKVMVVSQTKILQWLTFEKNKSSNCALCTDFNLGGLRTGHDNVYAASSSCNLSRIPSPG
jgi:hypothetical protein